MCAYTRTYYSYFFFLYTYTFFIYNLFFVPLTYILFIYYFIVNKLLFSTVEKRARDGLIMLRGGGWLMPIVSTEF